MDSQEEIRIKVDSVLPAGWKVVGIKRNAVPYNLTVLEGEKEGTSYELRGPSMVWGSRKYNKMNESFTMWIMHPEYSASISLIAAQFEEAKRLGENSEIAVYVKTFASSTPTWKSWKEDIVELLKLK